MNRILFFSFWIWIAAGILVRSEADALPSVADEAKQTAVVYNAEYAPSETIAKHYAELRGVPAENILALHLKFQGGITRTDYDQKIESPIIQELSKRGLLFSTNNTIASNAVRYLVLCRGIPFVIYDDQRDMHPLQTQKGAAVDNELASLLLRKQNPEVGLDGPMRCLAVSNMVPSQLGPATGLLMVARLDGPSDEIANGLVDKAVLAEKQGLWGRAVVDVRGLTNTGYLEGDTWLRSAGESFRRRGFELYLDEQPETIAKNIPLPATAFYAGWYDYNSSGPFRNGLVEFVPGAFAYHLHSFSAQNLFTTTNHWVGPLLQNGATCSVGYVDEPFLTFTLNVGMFTDWFLRGASFGEAVYHASPALSWQQTVVGDPLYRPFRFSGLERVEFTAQRSPSLMGWVNVQAANINLLRATNVVNTKDLEKFKARLLAQMDALLQQTPGDYALSCWIIRAYIEQKKKAEALSLIETILSQSDLNSVRRCYLLLQKAQLLSSQKNYSDANATYLLIDKEYPQLHLSGQFLDQWAVAAKKSRARQENRLIETYREQLK